MRKATFCLSAQKFSLEINRDNKMREINSIIFILVYPVIPVNYFVYCELIVISASFAGLVSVSVYIPSAVLLRADA